MNSDETATSPARSTGSPRRTSVDGLRGFAYLWVVAGHFWILVPHEDTIKIPFIGWLFEAGNRGVTIFLVLAGFFAARSLIAYREHDQVRRTAWWTVRRVLRVTLAMIPLLIVVAVVQHFEQPNPFPGANTTTSIVAILTNSWNVFLADDPLVARPDLGHLWYISVYVQAIVALAAVFLITRGRTRLVVPLLTAALIAVTIYRTQAVERHDLFVALIQTTTRVDGILWGALLAFAISSVKLKARTVQVVGLTSLVLVFVLAWYSTPLNYFQWPGVLNNVVVCLLITAAWLSTPDQLLGRVLSSRAATAIGARSLTIYVWHYPLFWFISRHTADWMNVERSLTALVALIAIVEFMHREWDEPMRVWINRRFSSRLPA